MKASGSRPSRVRRGQAQPVTLATTWTGPASRDRADLVRAGGQSRRARLLPPRRWTGRVVHATRAHVLFDVGVGALLLLSGPWMRQVSAAAPRLRGPRHARGRAPRTTRGQPGANHRSAPVAGHDRRSVRRGPARRVGIHGCVRQGGSPQKAVSYEACRLPSIERTSAARRGLGARCAENGVRIMRDRPAA